MLNPFIARGEELLSELAQAIGYDLVYKRDMPVTLLEVYDWMYEAIRYIPNDVIVTEREDE